MKPSRQNKVIGLALGEQSLLAAEIVVSGDKREVRRVARFDYPAGISLEQPVALGQALGTFLSQKEFSAKAAVVGLPARWLVVKNKDVPQTDASTLIDLLRLQAESEFSSELKDLVFDFNGQGGTGSVLLLATRKQHIDTAVSVCNGARLNAVVVTASAVALGAATGRGSTADVLVLSIGTFGAELTSQVGGASTAIRHLRPSEQDKAFTSEVRRAVLMMGSGGGVNGKRREMIMWDGSARLNAKTLGDELGVSVRSPELASLGVSNGPSVNGTASNYVAAVALALEGIGDHRPGVDFLHSRLAPPPRKLVPTWAIYATLGALVAIGLIAFSWSVLNGKRAEVANLQKDLVDMEPRVKSADAFIKASAFADGWDYGNARYLTCLRDVTASFPDDGQTYATSLIIREVPKPTGADAKKPSAAAQMSAQGPVLNGRIDGKTSDLWRVQNIVDQLKRRPGFVDAKLGSAQEGGQRAQQVSYSITFTYVPPAAAATPPSGAAPTTSPATNPSAGPQASGGSR